MASRSLEVQRRLLQRLHRVVSEWPTDASRKGRDLGEYLKETYVQRFKDESAVDTSKAAAAIASLEKLNSNHYRRQYPREKEYSFSGELVVKNPWVLSNENLKAMQKKSESLWRRLVYRKTGGSE